MSSVNWNILTIIVINIIIVVIIIIIIIVIISFVRRRRIILISANVTMAEKLRQQIDHIRIWGTRYQQL